MPYVDIKESGVDWIMDDTGEVLGVRYAGVERMFANTAGGVPNGSKGDIVVSNNGGSWTIPNGAVTPAKTSGLELSIPAGTPAQYYRGDKTFQELSTTAVPEGDNLYHTAVRVLSTPLAGINTTVGGAVSSGDGILTAFGKVQKQLTDNAAALAAKADAAATTAALGNIETALTAILGV